MVKHTADKTQRTVKALFERDKKILLVKDQKGVWELPGGRINPGEKPQQTLRRELQEELGWNRVDIKSTVDYWSFAADVRGAARTFLVTVYFCETDEETIKENEEYTEFRWVPVSELENLNMRDGYKNSIKKFLSRRM
ncbi:MAG: NUDIX hydrolase [Candidatus Kerfeldbacteria bacterium]|nr:NUDIX hydrolase [Candidatus Kerfeldbacteria bacterium]